MLHWRINEIQVSLRKERFHCTFVHCIENDWNCISNVIRYYNAWHFPIKKLLNSNFREQILAQLLQNFLFLNFRFRDRYRYRDAKDLKLISLSLSLKFRVRFRFRYRNANWSGLGIGTFWSGIRHSYPWNTSLTLIFCISNHTYPYT